MPHSGTGAADSRRTLVLCTYHVYLIISRIIIPVGLVAIVHATIAFFVLTFFVLTSMREMRGLEEIPPKGTVEQFLQNTYTTLYQL
jgi:hypothetical protein